MAWMDGRRGVEVRRQFGIVAFLGPNGGGKTLAAVSDCLPSLDAGRPVLSTVRLLDFRNPRPCEDDGCEWDFHPIHGQAHPSWVPLRGWDDLLSAEGCDVLLDEVTGVASSRESQGLPAVVANTLVQLRRRDVRLMWTTPAWSRADKLIRECTQAVVWCTGHVSRPMPGRVWRSNTILSQRLIDAREMDEVTEGKRDSSRAINRSWVRMAACEARHAYDTLARVLAIPLIEGGRCVACGGRRRVPSCSCDAAQ